MKVHSFFFSLFLFFLVGCDYFPKEDTHPEVPFFEDLIKDRSVFEPIATVEKNNSDGHHLYVLNNGKYLSVIQSMEEIKSPASDDKKVTEYQSVFDIKILDLSNQLYFKDIIKSITVAPVIIDKNANLYVKGYLYLSPDYRQKKKMDLINITDSLSARTLSDTIANTDSLKKIHLSLLEKKYKFKQEDGGDYTIQSDQLILFNNPNITVDAEQKQSYFDTFDETILVEYRNDNRIFPSSYYYYYYQIGKIKFKYFDGKSGTQNPMKIEYGGQTYVFHPKFGIYRIIKK